MSSPRPTPSQNSPYAKDTRAFDRRERAMCRILDQWGRSHPQIAMELHHGTASSVKRAVANNYKEKDDVEEDYAFVTESFAERYPRIVQVKERFRDARGRRAATVVIEKRGAHKNGQARTEERRIYLTPVAAARLKKRSGPAASSMKGMSHNVRRGQLPYALRSGASASIKEQPPSVACPSTSEEENTESAMAPDPDTILVHTSQHGAQRARASSSNHPTPSSPPPRTFTPNQDFLAEYRLQAYSNLFRVHGICNREDCLELARDCRLDRACLVRVLEYLVPEVPMRKLVPFCVILIEEAAGGD
ncbi:hypothetical protein HDZ31DRAFT_68087 [Schizophyllum fasciatum]